MLSILVPSRERPELLNRFLKSVDDTILEAVEILVFVDHDEPRLEEYEFCIHNWRGKLRVELFTAKGITTVGQAWNFLYKRSIGDFLMMGNDDLVCITQGWDAIVKKNLVESYDDAICLAWTNDLSGQSHTHCAFPIVHRTWVETLGYFTTAHFHFLLNDTWIFDIAKKLDRLCYLPDVKIEHRHFAFQKAKYDNTYKKHRVGEDAKEKRRYDFKVYKELEYRREEDAQKLYDYIKSRGIK